MAEDAKSPRKDEFFIIFQVGVQLQNFVQLLVEESVLKLKRAPSYLIEYIAPVKLKRKTISA